MSDIEILVLLTAALFILKVLRDAAGLLWLFQIKEYRLDRLRSHWRENIRFNLGDLDLAIGIIIMLAVLFPATFEFLAVAAALILGALTPLYFLSAALQAARDGIRHSFKRPRPTAKMLLIAGVFFALYALFLLGLGDYAVRHCQIIYSLDFFLFFSFGLLILNASVPLFVLLAIALVTPLADMRKKKIVKRARLKMEGLRRVKTIGITGSFGKTSTKEFLFAILASKYKVVKTSGNNNTLMGVASTILGNVSDDYDFFICEMGAYKRGEIAEISDVARPFAGIITGINEQHLDLFGSLENTKCAKFELVESLPADGFAVIQERAQAMYPQIQSRVRDLAFFSPSLAGDIAVSPDHVEFTYKGVKMRANLPGKHYVQNLLAAIVTAEKLGMQAEEIAAALAKMPADSDYLMHCLPGPRGSVFIDDSYSANRNGVIAALTYLEDAYPDRQKMLVFPGIIELGQSSAAVHREIFEQAARICRYVFLLGKPEPSIIPAAEEGQFIFEQDFDKMKEAIADKLDNKSVVLFESRGAGVVMRKLLADKKR